MNTSESILRANRNGFASYTDYHQNIKNTHFNRSYFLFLSLPNYSLFAIKGPTWPRWHPHPHRQHPHPHPVLMEFPTCDTNAFTRSAWGLFQAANICFSWWVIKWMHFLRYLQFVRGNHRFPLNFPQKGQWRGALMFSLICVWINGWKNIGEAGDLMIFRA